MKTFYSVDYIALGMMRASTRWFDNLEEAKEFAKEDFRDNPVRHTYKNEKKIKEIERLIEIQ